MRVSLVWISLTIGGIAALAYFKIRSIFRSIDIGGITR